MKLRPVSAAVLLALSSLTLAAHADGIRRPYIVQLADKPVASYTGGVEGIAATRPEPGNVLNLDTAAAAQYTTYLEQKQATVQSSVASAPVLHNYSVVMNGFAAMLTDDEVRQLQARTDVASVEADVPRTLTTTSTTSFLGLDKANGLWSKLGGNVRAGEDIIIGIVDSGIWPESLSYADRVDANGKPTFDGNGTVAYTAPPASFKGTCQTGEGFTVAHCNNKLIGARYFDAGYKANSTAGTHWSEFVSPRDSVGGSVGHGGHGTHTSTTAGGNAGSDAVVGGITVGTVSGMAPRARISSYKVCWTFNLATDPTGGKNSCWTTDSVKAIEEAVKDGVHVINFSISGGTSITDPVEQAFLAAANAGVFVAASAGNSGPANEVAHISPWLTTVAASTHNRLLKADVTLGNGATYSGGSMNLAPLAPAPIIRSVDAGVTGADTEKLRLCYSASFNGGVAVLDPAKVAGKVVTCDRDVNPRVDKSLAVSQAGGVGMVMVDNGLGLIGEVHSVPTVHVSVADGALIKAYATTQGASAGMGKFAVGTSSVDAPVMADFSSRGPNRYDPNVLKPDLTAPGVDIIAGVTPGMSSADRDSVANGTMTPQAAHASLQGTSMSSPHVAGLAALLRQQNPSWSPAMIKSALMTTGTMTFTDNRPSPETGTLPWGQGAGHVNPNGASDPGLVYNLGELDYKRYQCGAGISSACAGGIVGIAGYNLNLPSITLSNVLGTVVVNRSVTNVGSATAVYNGTVSVPGFTATLSPTSLSLLPGQTKPFTVTLVRNGAAENVWQFGKLEWKDGTHVVRSPVSARSGKPVIAPTLVKSNKASATRMMTVSTGFTGKMNTIFGGLKEVTRTPYSLAQAVNGSVDDVPAMVKACNDSAPGAMTVPVTIPAGALAASFELFNRDTSSNGGDDLDLVLLTSAGALVDLAAHFGSNEAFIMPKPAAGSYKLCVINYAAANEVSTDFTLSSAIVTAADRGGNFKAVVPTKVYSGSSASVGVIWSGLPAGKRYLGGVQLLDLNQAPATTTLFQVETGNPVPLGEPTVRPAKRDSGL